MANPEVPSGLKDLNIKIQSSSFKERQQTVNSIIEILSNQEVSEGIIRGICRLLPSTLHRYKDRPSQYLIKKLLSTLICNYPDVATRYLIELFSDVTSQFQNVVITDNVSQGCLNILEWTTILLQHSWTSQTTVIKQNGSKIIETQALLLLYVIACKRKKKITKALALFDSIWKNLANSNTFYLDTLKSFEQTPQVVILEATLIRSFPPGNSLITESLVFILDGFIKNFVSCKKPPLSSAVEACYPLLALISLEQFKKTVSPALQKAMLRNPEVILETVGIIISGVQIDLSSCSIEIGNHLITNLHSKDEKARADSVTSIKLLAEKIKQVNAVDELLKKTFDVYHGSDGKLTIIEHKIGVLQGAGNLCFNSVPIKNFPELITKVITHFVKVLESEAQEKALCYTLDMLALWTRNLVSEVPKVLIDIFKKGINLKSSTPLVKCSYIQCMLSTFKEDNISQAAALIPILLKSVEKAVSQPTQHLSVSEGLYASLLLMNMSSAKLEKENEFATMWNAVFDMNKQIFVSEKFLQATTESLPYVTELCKKLLLEYPKKIGNKQHLEKAILFCAMFPSRPIRKKCLSIVEELVVSNSGLAIGLLLELNQQLDQSHKNIDENAYNSAQAAVECITTLCSINSTSKNARLLVTAAVLPSHHPLVVCLVPNLWIKVLKRLNFDATMCIENTIGELTDVLVENYEPDQKYENALATLVRNNSKVILPHILLKVQSYLEDPRICQVTKDDYFTFLTPEGELYDKSVIPGEENKNEMNLKRESRAYSYKDQLEEMQLRRELDEKRKKDGKSTEVSYTPKQLEAIKGQLVKEDAIRNRLRELNSTILKSISMIEAASKGNAKELSLHYKDLLSLILQDLQSPLASPLLLKLFTKLRKTVFSGELHNSLRDVVAFVTLRLSKPQCDLDPYWETEDLNKAINRIIGLIHNHTVTKNNEGRNNGRFDAPTFSYVFPLLKLSLSSPYAKQHDNLMHDGIQIISEHAKLRGDDNNNDIDLNHPKYLPTKQMFILLMDIICTSNSRIQAQAEACLLDVANCISGNNGCARASLEEIDVLLTALQNSISVVRDAALRALILIEQCLPNYESNYNYTLNLYKRIWIAKFDEIEENRLLANNLWISANMTFPTSLSSQLLSDVEHPVECVQAAAALALADLLTNSFDQIQPTIKALLKLYSDRLKMIPAKVDEFGREIEKPIDTWFPRRGVAFAIGRLAQLITPESAGDLMHFFVSSSLSDRNEIVRKEMLNAALRIVNLHGKDTVGILWPIFDNFMGKSSKSAHFDAVKQAVVVLMGSLARHLDKEDERIKPIFGRLIQALSTPSQTVQEAVSNCLPPLVQSVKDDVPGYVNKLMHQLLKADKYGDRKGAAYGLAGLVKGMGILALKQYDIMNKLTDAVQDKKNYKHREGALFAFEMLFQMLGKLFEPYIVHVLPHLLQCFGDSSQYVRTAADDTAKVVMSKLSGHGVKLVLPSLLDALEEDSWRTKTGSVELLGAMAYCAPKQLSSCLPSIVPKLIEVLSDSHMKVQEAGATALKVIGSVIRNPEIQAIVPTLLKALQDPSNRTSVCLQTLLDTQFVHFIDAPSLALIMPVVQRAFMDRSTETRKMAAQIIGNMYSLTDQKDLMPYLPTIIPGLKTSLLDPVPEVRSVSARALGAMVRGMGETSFEDLLPWLMHTLTSETSSVDRSGAAQGLSEVVGGLGVEKLHKLMPEIISTAERTDIAPHVKDGYIMLFIYMPVVFADQFTPYIGQIINPILKALADENEYVRDTALKAGQRIVNLYADSAILLLLPELEKGLFDDNWRIRYSSVQLLGDLLYRISGVTGKMSTETASEDDNFGTEQSHKAIIQALGAERRNRVLAGLYMGRSDVSLMVRQSALHVWKVVVTNTPRTLREILPTLFGLLLGCLASDSFDKRQVAARTLGDLVRKLGERVLPDIIPILERGLESNRPDQRQGVCIGLSEIMASTSKDMVLNFVHSLVPTVRKALADPLPEVRQAAAKTFDSLHSTVGTRALDDILPTLLHQLGGEDPQIVEYTLDGLRQVMAIKSRVVLPYLVPQLTAPPANTKALSILASVAGEALNKYLPKILPALQNALAAARGTPEEAQQLEYCQAVILSVVDDIGIRTIIDTMLEDTKNDNVDQRRAAATLLCAFCANSKAQYTAHVPQLLRALIHLCTDNDRDVLQMSWDALNAVTKTLEPKQQATFVSDVRQAVRFAMSDMKRKSELLPGFCLPKGIAPILPIFREAILSGDADEKEAAAQGLGEVIKVTSASALQPSVVAITGPLIRILGDRFSPQVKTAVLDTLAILLSKVGLMLKQFLPQLQTTFIKSLNDSNRHVRVKSGAALGQLILIHQRADPLFTEIHNMIKNNEENAIKETSLHALRGMISPAGDKMSEMVKKQIHNTLASYLSYPDDTVRRSAAGCLGAICSYLSEDQLDVTLDNILNDDPNVNTTLREGRATSLTVALKEAPERLWNDRSTDKLIKSLLSQLSSSVPNIIQSAIRSCGYLFNYLLINDERIPPALLAPFVRTMNNQTNDVKQLLAKVCFYLAKMVPSEKMTAEFLKSVIPMLVNGTKEKNVYVKANSEIALTAVLKLKEGDTVYQKYSALLDVGPQESLSDVVSKVLKKMLQQPEGKDEDIDDTLLT